MHVSEVGIISMASTIAPLVGSLFSTSKNQILRYSLARAPCVLNGANILCFPSEIQICHYQWLKISSHITKYQE